MDIISIIKSKCKLCRKCLDVCLVDAISVRNNEISINNDKCNYCGACIDACPFDAIVKQVREAKYKDQKKYRDIWVFAEHKEGKPVEVVYELLGEARRLVKGSDHKVAGVLLGNNCKRLAKNLIDYGADTIYLVDNPLLKYFRDEPYVYIMGNLIKEFDPLAILFGATSTGRSFAPRLAAHIGTGLSADCTKLELNNMGVLVQTRPAFGGNLFANILCLNSQPQMATVRPKVMKSLQPNSNRHGHIIQKEYSLSSLIVRTNRLKVVKQISEVNIEDARIVVGAGIGVVDAKGITLVRNLARALGGVIGASRKVVDKGLIMPEYQVGQTGKTITPDIYIACGISGAVQHIVGIQSSRTIIAINVDSEAPIFKIAHIGIEGDLYEVLPILIEKINTFY